MGIWTRGPAAGALATWAVVAAVVVAAGCGDDGGDTEAIDRLMATYADGDYFALASGLDSVPDLGGPRITFLRAVSAHVFNRPADSNRHLRELGDGVRELPDSLQLEVARLAYRNHVRLSSYGAALEAARELVALATDSSTIADTRNEMRAMAALSEAAPQRVVRRGEVVLEPVEPGRYPVALGDSGGRPYVFDTGANLSVLLESEVEALGLEVREAGLEVGTSTGSTVRADVAVAPRVRIGAIELENVAFLVFPDEVLTFGPVRIRGIMGFPVLDALGELEFGRDGTIRVPADVPERAVRNLAMDYLTPMVRVRALEADAVCEFDTGANATSFHLPFYRAHRARVEALGRFDTIRTAGAGGERRIPSWVLTDVRVELADTAVVLPEVDVYTEALSADGSDDDCRLGLDALAGFDGYLLNLRSMTFMPR